MNKKPMPRRSRAEWQGIIAGQESIGESVPAYCRQHQLSEKSFYGWRRRLGMNSQADAERFIRVEPAREGPGRVMRIRTPKGYCREIPEGIDGAYVKPILAVVVGL